MSEQRVIKFKLWLIHIKLWFEEGFSISQDGLYFYNHNDEEFPIKDTAIICQFTGHIVAGEEIYESDIVENIMGDYGVVYFDQSHAAFMIKYSYNPEPVFMDRADNDYKKIGDIYSTPNLLQK